MVETAAAAAAVDLQRLGLQTAPAVTAAIASAKLKIHNQEVARQQQQQQQRRADERLVAPSNVSRPASHDEEPGSPAAAAATAAPAERRPLRKAAASRRQHVESSSESSSCSSSSSRDNRIVPIFYATRKWPTLVVPDNKGSGQLKHKAPITHVPTPPQPWTGAGTGGGSGGSRRHGGGSSSRRRPKPPASMLPRLLPCPACQNKARGGLHCRVVRRHPASSASDWRPPQGLAEWLAEHPQRPASPKRDFSESSLTTGTSSSEGEGGGRGDRRWRGDYTPRGSGGGTRSPFAGTVAPPLTGKRRGGPRRVPTGAQRSHSAQPGGGGGGGSAHAGGGKGRRGSGGDGGGGGGAMDDADDIVIEERGSDGEGGGESDEGGGGEGDDGPLVPLSLLPPREWLNQPHSTGATNGGYAPCASLACTAAPARAMQVVQVQNGHASGARGVVIDTAAPRTKGGVWLTVQTAHGVHYAQPSALCVVADEHVLTAIERDAAEVAAAAPRSTRSLQHCNKALAIVSQVRGHHQHPPQASPAAAEKRQKRRRSSAADSLAAGAAAAAPKPGAWGKKRKDSGSSTHGKLKLSHMLLTTGGSGGGGGGGGSAANSKRARPLEGRHGASSAGSRHTGRGGGGGGGGGAQDSAQRRSHGAAASSASGDVTDTDDVPIEPREPVEYIVYDFSCARIRPSDTPPALPTPTDAPTEAAAVAAPGGTAAGGSDGGGSGEQKRRPGRPPRAAADATGGSRGSGDSPGALKPRVEGTRTQPPRGSRHLKPADGDGKSGGGGAPGATPTGSSAHGADVGGSGGRGGGAGGAGGGGGGSPKRKADALASGGVHVGDRVKILETTWVARICPHVAGLTAVVKSVPDAKGAKGYGWHVLTTEGELPLSVRLRPGDFEMLT
ncbi:hypothetical protein JKP88DRAFT_262246 [Tribonema minus]|uniref:Uncharacterized protein n=1 Tax=Tribonema minus TaxID=303371 RepID=A0A835Z8P7_9STRA|nr:hypothetical protein JKP88DRAFT_262246 [Tribonema minus]